MNLPVKENDLCVLVTFPEAACLYEVREKCRLRDLEEEALWVKRVVHLEEAVGVEEISRVEKDVLGRVRRVLSEFKGLKVTKCSV